jgi:hypothetical protein
MTQLWCVELTVRNARFFGMGDGEIDGFLQTPR